MKSCAAFFNSVIASLLLLALCQAAASAAGADASIDQAVTAFKAGHTQDALTRFQMLLKSNPSNVTVHYYLGQCYQNLNQPEKAKSEFQWVVSNGKDKAATEDSKKRLASLAKTSARPAASAPVAAAGALTGRPSVIDFFAVWCVPCKKFEPTFNKVAADFKGKVDFLHVDVDDPKQKALVDKYKVTVMPTFVFRDAAGKAKLINEGVMKEPAFVEEVNNLLK